MSTVEIKLQLGLCEQTKLNDLMEKELLHSYEEAIYFLIRRFEPSRSLYDSLFDVGAIGHVIAPEINLDLHERSSSKARRTLSKSIMKK